MPRLSLVLFIGFAGCFPVTNLKEFNVEPEAEITSHADDSEVYEGVVERFRGSVTDPNHSTDELVVIWYQGTEEVCAATAPATDGTTSCDILITDDATQISLEVRDPLRAAGSDIVPIVVIPTASPEAIILTPEADGVYYADQKISFTGYLSDGEDNADALVAYWKSDIEGVLSVDATPNSNGEVEGFGYLTEGQHAIQLHVEDSTGKTDAASVLIDVGPPNTAPTCAITAPLDGHAVAEGEALLFEGQVDDVDVAEDWLTVTWESDVDGTLRESSPDTDGSVGFSYGDLTVATHRVTMTVADEVGETCSDSIYITVGTPPLLIVSTPKTGDVENEGEDVSFIATVSDNEDLPTAISLRWSSSLDGDFSTQGADSSGNILFSTDALSTGDHVLTARATDTDGLYAETSINVTINATPTAPTVSINPTPARTNNDLVASATGSVDPDTSGTVTYRYAWYEDGILSSASTTATFPRASTTKDHTYKVVVTPSDGTGDGELGEAEVAVINTDPVLTGPTLSASTVVVGDTLTCSASAADDDTGDSLTITYTWSDGTTGSSYTVDANDDPGDTITCTATVDDGDGGTDTGTTSASVDNTDPVMGTVSVTPSSGTVGETITCSASATDADGDTPTISYTWHDGSTGATYTIVEDDDPGDPLTCTATAEDRDGGTDTGTATASVENTDPVLGTVSISPGSANNDETLTCSASGTDADGEAPTITYSWLNKTSGTGLGSGSSIDLSTTSAASSDTIECTATATDADGGTDSGTADITLENRTPSLGVSITPDPATRDDTLRCTATASDDDDDTLTTSFSWTVGGGVESATSTSGLTSTLSGRFEGGDVVVCTVETDDGKTGGVATASASVTISNQAPSVTGVSLSPNPVYTNNTLTVSATVTDADGDTLTTTHDWYVDGTRVQSGPSNTLSGVDFFDKDQDVYVIVTADDGTDSTHVTSGTLGVSNSPPGAPVVAISPASPEEGDALTCEVLTESDDDDGDAVHYSMVWTVDDVAYTDATSTTWTDDTVDGGEALADEVWECVVTPSDGDDNGATATDQVTIEGRAPVTTSLTLASYSFVGESSGDTAGISVSSAGDVDGDGFDDILVGAYGSDDGGSNSGKAYLFLASSLGSSTTIDLADADYSFIGEESSDLAGGSVACAGDVDGDGLDDILIGAHWKDTFTGKAYLILAGSLGSSATIDLADADYSFVGESTYDSTGISVASAGDVDGDELDDILIGSSGSDDGGSNAGKTSLFLASSLGSSATIDIADADYSFVGEYSGDAAGEAASAGDVDGDGLGDILIGAYNNGDEGLGAGKTYLILASSLGSSATIDLSDADYSFVGENSDDWSGTTVASAGDVDGDGLDDILIGALYNDDADTNAGKVYLILAGSLGSSTTINLVNADYSFLGESSGDIAGGSIASAGDVDGDGYDDILIGAPKNAGSSSETGKVYLIRASSLGSSTTIDLTDADYSFVGENGDDMAGICVASAGDVDGDGLADTLIGAIGSDEAANNAGEAYLILSGD